MLRLKNEFEIVLKSWFLFIFPQVLGSSTTPIDNYGGPRAQEYTRTISHFLMAKQERTGKACLELI